jgi:3-hydroxy acid dehydrogenase / malonic semialdehyde reductase
MDKQMVCITGATSGFGLACAKKFSALGYDLILLGRREDRLISIAKEIGASTSINIHLLIADVQDKVQLKNAFESLPIDVKSKISILINNAGLARGREPFYEGNLTDWDEMIDTNVKGLLYVSRIVTPFLIANKTGHIINIASIAGKEAYAGGNVYCASKQAVDALSRSMRIDLLEHNIKVTNIAPGAADTEFSFVRYHGDQQKADSTYDGFDPLQAEDIADAVIYAATRPAHVCINDLVIMPTAQANATTFYKK